ncbi:family 20 glycosylhydrolase [Massilia soli]|nr:family 20 glycosylhydrolase [Massilia soli]
MPPIAIEWECLSNLASDATFSARLSMRNVSNQAIAPGWTVYLNTCRKTLDSTVTPGYTMKHINGDLFCVTAETNQAWQPGEAHTIKYDAQHWAISDTDAPLGFYLVPGDAGPVIDLGDPVIMPFELAQQRHRHNDDRVPASDAAQRFRQNEQTRLLPLDQVGRITPRPLSARFSAEVCVLKKGSQISHNPALDSEERLLRAMLDRLPSGDGARIELEVGPIALDGAPGEEAYMLAIEPDKIVVRGNTPHGVFNGIQSLAQLLSADGTVPAGHVIDAPRFRYRGMMLDVARHFAGKETVMRLLDCMARFKLNRFHFHLTDDEGWRLQIAALPELTDIGARRGVAAKGEPSLPPSFGSGADVAASAGSGYYNAGQFTEILRYAHARHIEVVPEFNMPGHARAAVMAMRERYDRLRAAGDIEGASEYLLSDPGDESVYESVQLWHDNVICIALPSVDRFIDTVVSEVASLYRSAGVPLRTVHTGGDEVPAGAWLGSPICHARMKEQGWTEVSQLHADFVQRCRRILARHGLAYAGWEETALIHACVGGRQQLLPAPELGGPESRVYVWNNTWGSGTEDCAYRLANAGYNVVLSNAASLYFDMAYAKDPDEPGYYWAGFVETRQAFTFCPLDTTITPGRNAMGHDITPAVFEPLDSAGAARIAGIQGQLWGENSRSRERIEYLAAPRLIALAERAWAADPGWYLIADPDQRASRIDSDWNEFANRLGQRVLPQLDEAPLAYGYRLPPPGLVLKDGALHANVALPGLALHYTTDGSEPGIGSRRYRAPLVVSPDWPAFRIATLDTRGRRSRTVTFYPEDAP